MEFHIHRFISVLNFLKDEYIYDSTSSLSGALFRFVLALASTHAKSIPEVIFFLHFLFSLCQWSCSAAVTEGCLWQDFVCLFSLLEQKKKNEICLHLAKPRLLHWVKTPMVAVRRGVFESTDAE